MGNDAVERLTAQHETGFDQEAVQLILGTT